MEGAAGGAGLPAPGLAGGGLDVRNSSWRSGRAPHSSLGSGIHGKWEHSHVFRVMWGQHPMEGLEQQWEGGEALKGICCERVKPSDVNFLLPPVPVPACGRTAREGCVPFSSDLSHLGQHNSADNI